MLTRTFDGRASVTAGMLDFYREVMTEDGPVERRFESPVVEARTPRGRLYAVDQAFDSEADAERYVAGLPADFDPATHAGFRFVRTVYGSPDWSEQDEVGLMDDAERSRYERGF